MNSTRPAPLIGGVNFLPASTDFIGGAARGLLRERGAGADEAGADERRGDSDARAIHNNPPEMNVTAADCRPSTGRDAL